MRKGCPDSIIEQQGVGPVKVRESAVWRSEKHVSDKKETFRVGISNLLREGLTLGV